MFLPTTRKPLRANPGSLDSWRGICSKSPEHDADHGEADECSNGRCVAFEVASQATVTTDPRLEAVITGQYQPVVMIAITFARTRYSSR